MREPSPGPRGRGQGPGASSVSNQGSGKSRSQARRGPGCGPQSPDPFNHPCPLSFPLPRAVAASLPLRGTPTSPQCGLAQAGIEPPPTEDSGAFSQMEKFLGKKIARGKEPAAVAVSVGGTPPPEVLTQLMSAPWGRFAPCPPAPSILCCPQKGGPWPNSGLAESVLPQRQHKFRPSEGVHRQGPWGCSAHPRETRGSMAGLTARAGIWQIQDKEDARRDSVPLSSLPGIHGQDLRSPHFSPATPELEQQRGEGLLHPLSVFPGFPHSPRRGPRAPRRAPPGGAGSD